MTLPSCLLNSIKHKSCQTVVSSLEGIEKTSCPLETFVEEYPETFLVRGSCGQPLEGNVIPQTGKGKIPSELLELKPALLLNKITSVT